MEMKDLIQCIAEALVNDFARQNFEACRTLSITHRFLVVGILYSFSATQSKSKILLFIS